MTRKSRSKTFNPSGQAQQGSQPQAQTQQSQSLAGQVDPSRSAFGQIADTVREHPKTAIAAGAAVAAGVAAAAVYGARSRNSSDD
jgi:hypothetical protein